MTRLVGFCELKALDEDQRVLEGWASRPEVDRAGDVVESKGARFRLPLPLLVDHNHQSACGEVFEAKVTAEGIRFKARVAKIEQAGPLKTLCDDAWQMVRNGLRKAVSVGFRDIDSEPLATGGRRFKAWDWYELSLCSVPMLASATIDVVRAHDRKLRERANPGRVVRLARPVSAAVEAALDHAAKGGGSEVFAASIGAIARTTDDCLTQLDQRLARLEAGPRKDVLAMDPDEFLAHVRAQRALAGAA